jgi:hypothetical protein
MSIVTYKGVGYVNYTTRYKGVGYVNYTTRYWIC